jgi:hypothetical protein
MQAAKELSARLEHRRAAHARIAEKKSADKFKGVGRWGGEMFCRLFYSTLKQHGHATRDTLFDDGKPQPRYVREMNIVLGLVDDKGQSKEEFANALVTLIGEWSSGLTRKKVGDHPSVYDLRYRLEDMFGGALPTRTTDEEFDTSELFQEETENEG